MSSRHYQEKWLDFTQSQALSHQRRTLSLSSQGYIPPSMHYHYLHHEPQVHQEQPPPPPHSQGLSVDMELAELLNTNASSSDHSNEYLLPSLSPPPQHLLNLQYNNLEAPLILEQAHIPPQAYTIPVSLPSDENNVISNPFPSCQYYPAGPEAGTPVDPPSNNQRECSRPLSIPAVGYHSTVTPDPNIDNNDNDINSSNINCSNAVPEEQRQQSTLSYMPPSLSNLHPLQDPSVASHHSNPTPPILIPSDQTISNQQQRLTHESWYLSQPYHIGMPQPPSQYTQHHQELNYYVTHTFCPFHKKFIDLPVFPTHQMMEHTAHCVHPQQLQTGNQCVPSEGNALPFDHHQVQGAESQTTRVPKEQQQSGSSRQLEQNQVAPPTSQAHSRSTRSHTSRAAVGRSSSTVSTLASSTETNHSSVPWPLPPSPLPSTFFSTREEPPPKPQKTEQAAKMLEFAKNFKKKRTELGFSAEGVAQQVNIRFGSIVCPPLCGGLVLKFESGSLSQQNMSKLKQYLEGWLIDTERARGASEEQAKAATRPLNYDKKERKRRTKIDKYHRMKLEEEFERNCRPSRAEIHEIVNKFGNGLLDSETVRVWFCNRRMRSKTSGMPDDSDDDDEEPPWPKLIKPEAEEDTGNEEEGDQNGVEEGESGGRANASS